MSKSQHEILRDFSLRSTNSRSDILKLFIDQHHALSYSDIEREVSSQYDRVTVYRTLRTFLDKGMIHKVLDDSGAPKYALCSDTCSQAHHHHNHVHFKCTQCGQTNCLENVEIPIISLPQGYVPKEMNLLIQGVCQACHH
jgi:Fur family ferric uptake transcriptional regulator